MSLLTLLKSGVRHLLRGDIRTPLDWIGRQLIGQTLSNVPTIVDESASTPNFVQSNHSTATIQAGDTYYTALMDTLSGDVHISSPQPSDVLEFGIGNIQCIDSITVDVEFLNATSESQETVVFRNGLYDEEINHMPVVLSPSGQFSEARISVERCVARKKQHRSRREVVSSMLLDDSETVESPFLSMPSVNQVQETTRPILIVSVDTWRYDHIDAFGPLLDFLGDMATVPEEPRTQGFFTTPSHGSMFTGVHPGDHRHVMASQRNITPIPSELTTLGELLADTGYKNSGLVSHTRLVPNYGYGRGFNRFQLDNKRPSNWMQDEGNARSLIDQVRRWVDDDIRAKNTRLFYFLHLFDPHPPFYPPLPNFDRSKIDFDAIEKYLEKSTMTADDEDYLELLDHGVEVEDEILEEVTTTYREAVEYTGDRLLELLQHFAHHDVLDDTLLIITGDHGYEFGERGFTGAKSLYDANIRQGMIVKPPRDSTWSVPDQCDTIDILPTIAEEIDADVPEQCQGQPWQSKENDSSQPRITERIRQKHYNVAVEADGIKAIYTYHSASPNRPTSDQMADGPLREEYYDLSAVRDGRFEDCSDSLDEETKAQFRSTADEFASSSMNATAVTSPELRQPTQETEEQLRQLGYK